MKSARWRKNTHSFQNWIAPFPSQGRNGADMDCVQLSLECWEQLQLAPYRSCAVIRKAELCIEVTPQLRSRSRGGCNSFRPVDARVACSSADALKAARV